MPSVPIVSPSEMAMVLNSIGSSASRANAFLHLCRQTAQVEVAGHGFNPRIGDANQRTAEVRVSKSDGLEHGARARAIAPFGDSTADVLEIHGRKITGRAVKMGTRFQLKDFNHQGHEVARRDSFVRFPL